jgi:polynucleotide 5'-hydroxyl-kinase GRC3/NOL9
MESPPYAEWEEPLSILAHGPGTTLLLGGTDVGKTTFVRLLVNRLVENKQRIAVIDADVGQSEIGPPACVGLAFAASPILALSDLSPHSLGFVGNTTPHGHALEYLTAVQRLAALADAEGNLIVDTPGYIHGAGGRRLHQATFDMLSPRHVVALQRGEELQHIIAPFRRRSECRVHTPAIPAVIGKKPPAYRAQRRVMRFASYFDHAKSHTYSFDDVAFVGTWMGGGTPLPAHVLEFVRQTLGKYARVYYGELSDRHLGLMTDRPLPPHLTALGVIQRELKTQALSVTVAPRLKHLLIGLESANGRMLGLGVLEALDFRRRTLGIVSPVRAPAAACILRFGLLRVQPDGTEVGTLKHNDL